MTIQTNLSKACEVDLEKYGDTFRGAGYTKSKADADSCYSVMLDLIRHKNEQITLLDFGCGLAHFYEYISNRQVNNIRYTGVDLSNKYLSAARSKHPNVEFCNLDVREDDSLLPNYDYIVMNGLFNYKGQYSQDEMMEYWLSMITVAFKHCNYGIAFNVMSKIVDWERDDLFHLPFDVLASHVSKNLSRNFVIRHDYGMYEYTTYVYKNSCR